MAEETDQLRYPADFTIEKQTDYFEIQVKSYSRKEGEFINSALIGEIKKTIYLPMPSNIQDANAVGWGEEKMNNITAGALKAIEGAMGINVFDLPTSVEQAKDKINKAITDSGITGQDASKLFNRSLAAEAVNIFGANVSVDQILARQSGKIFNPNLELLFSGVTLRDFRFSFKMTPRDEQESKNIKEIIRTLKKYMSANRAGKENLYLSTPYVFQPVYKTGSENHKFLHRFKPCALKGVSVNYTGENVYATYYDGTPISLIMDLNFQELQPFYSDEYDSGEGALGVGY
jgi:hypothetical protein